MSTRDLPAATGVEDWQGEGVNSKEHRDAHQRLHYDWSDPNRVVLTVTDSNTWGGHSGYTYTFGRQPDGTTEVRVVNVREGKNLKGRALALVLGSVGRSVLVKEFAKTVKAIEGRSHGSAGSDTRSTASAS